MQLKYHFISNRMFFFKLPTSVKNKRCNTKTGEHNGIQLQFVMPVIYSLPLMRLMINIYDAV
jgi:hypothetical protein